MQLARQHTIWLPKLGKLSFVNLHEALMLYKDIFWTKEYEFKTNKNHPVILDCGAHIGVSVLYFKRKYPNAKIIAFEPNPETFKLLTYNVNQNNLTQVMLINAALSDRNGKALFYVSTRKHSPWSWSDSLINRHNYGNVLTHTIKVKTVRLSSFITEPIDYLKIDVEGAEEKIFNEIKNKLKFVNQLVMEFHGGILKKQSLEMIKKILKKNDFAVVLRRLGNQTNDGKIHTIGYVIVCAHQNSAIK